MIPCSSVHEYEYLAFISAWVRIRRGFLSSSLAREAEQAVTSGGIAALAIRWKDKGGS